jgi:hypothetical protein
MRRPALLQKLKERIRYKTGAAEVSGSTARLRQLDQAVDQEQALQFGAAGLGFIGAILSLTVNSVFALLPAMAFATLGHYALRGWTPAMTLLQRLGLRSASDIDRERYAIAALIAEPELGEAAAE